MPTALRGFSGEGKDQGLNIVKTMKIIYRERRKNVESGIDQDFILFHNTKEGQH
jgi:hypothetical protein